MRPRLTVVKKIPRRFSITELLIVIAMVSVITGFAVVSVVRDRSTYCTNVAVEIANHLRNARIDSKRRGAKEISQMAQVRIDNRRSYSIAIDGDYDGYVDAPRVMSLPEDPGVEFNGPFPKIYIFDWQGQTVDPHSRPVTPQPMTVGNNFGTSAIKFSEDGKLTVVAAAKSPAAQ